MNFFEALRTYHDTQPHEVSVETQALCNARCTFCPYPVLERKGLRMSDELLEKILAEFATWPGHFYFSPFKINEPFLDKRLIPLCKKFNETSPHAYLRLFSNGSALTDANIEGAASLKNVAHLWISLNEVEAAAYETTMGLNFEITTKRLDRLHKAKQLGFPHEICISRVGGTFPERNLFRNYVAHRWPLFTPFVIKRDAWIDFTNPDNLEVPETPCSRWWELNITAEGKAITCCMDDGETPEYVLGDIAKQTMLEIYNSPRARARRESNNRKELDDTSPCSRCSY